MKFILAIVFVVYPLREAIALTIPKPQDLLDITAQINNARDADDQIVKKTRALDDTDDKSLKKNLKIEIASLEIKSKKAHEQALWLTIRAYDIIPFKGNEPILDKGRSVLRSPERGTEITWLPIYDEIGPKPTQDETGLSTGTRKANPDVVGNTASDGISRIFPGAFDSPAELASIIIHEKVHFRQNTTATKGDEKTTAELEVEAYEEEQRLLANDLLGFTEKARARQTRRLKEALDGKPGTIGKRELAEKERIEADRLRGGRPLPEWSLVSHSSEDLSRLVDQARKQIRIAQLDHDKRLIKTMLELTERSCNNPGSVTQAELEALPKAHDVNFWRTAVPARCYEAYQYIAQGGVDVGTLWDHSTPPPAVLHPYQPVQGARPDPQAVRPVPPPAFSTAFPDLETFASAACRDPEHVVIDVSYRGFLARGYDISQRTSDEDLAKQTSSRLGGCEGAVFYLLFEKIRASEGLWIDRDWVRKNVAASTPGSGAAPGGNGSNPCQIGGDPFGCQPRRPR